LHYTPVSLNNPGLSSYFILFYYIPISGLVNAKPPHLHKAVTLRKVELKFFI